MLHRSGLRCFVGALVSLGLAASFFLPSPVSAQQLIQNGSFEGGGGGSFAEWTILDQENSLGGWFIQTGTDSPLLTNTVPAPPDGLFSAMTDQDGSGSHILYQDFVVPSGVTSATLSFQYYLNNGAEDYFTQDSLDFTLDPNQQARVDLMTTTADPFSVAPGDVLQNVYQTQPGEALENGYFLHSVDITALLQANPGQTLRLRFAEVDNQFTFSNGVDAVSLLVLMGGGGSVPEPGTLALLSAGLGIVGMVARRRVK